MIQLRKTFKHVYDNSAMWIYASSGKFYEIYSISDANLDSDLRGTISVKHTLDIKI